MKRIISILFILVLLGSQTACVGAQQHADDGKITIVATTFPEYDWLQQLTAGSDRIELKLLIDTGVDLHSYQPSVSDIVTIATCDVFVYIGGASESWVTDALEAASNPHMTVIDLMAVLEQYRELCGGDHHDHDHDHDHDDHDHAADEHIWLSIVNARHICTYLSAWLQDLDPDNARLYASNAEGYLSALSAMDARYRATVDTAAHHTVIFADRFPFAYLMEDYGIHAHAAYEGCSAETEVSFVTVAELTAELDAEGLPGVLVIDDSDHRIADTVIAGSSDPSRKVYTLQSMQAIGTVDIHRGVTYLEIMDENLAVLQQVLN